MCATDVHASCAECPIVMVPVRVFPRIRARMMVPVDEIRQVRVRDRDKMLKHKVGAIAMCTYCACRYTMAKLVTLCGPQQY